MVALFPAGKTVVEGTLITTGIIWHFFFFEAVKKNKPPNKSRTVSSVSFPDDCWSQLEIWEKTIVCRTWLEMVLSMNDQKAQVAQEMKFLFRLANTFSECCLRNSVPQCKQEKVMAIFSVHFLNFSVCPDLWCILSSQLKSLYTLMGGKNNEIIQANLY